MGGSPDFLEGGWGAVRPFPEKLEERGARFQEGVFRRKYPWRSRDSELSFQDFLLIMGK